MHLCFESHSFPFGRHIPRTRYLSNSKHCIGSAYLYLAGTKSHELIHKSHTRKCQLQKMAQLNSHPCRLKSRRRNHGPNDFDSAVVSPAPALPHPTTGRLPRLQRPPLRRQPTLNAGIRKPTPRITSPDLRRMHTQTSLPLLLLLRTLPPRSPPNRRNHQHHPSCPGNQLNLLHSRGSIPAPYTTSSVVRQKSN